MFSRLGRTNSAFANLHDAGRLDIVQECIVASLFLSHGIRREVHFHSILNGPPDPPLHIDIRGEELYDVRTDISTWEHILKKVISRTVHPGIVVKKEGFESLLKRKAETSQIFVLEEDGKDVAKVEFEKSPVFVLGDHVGLPKRAENFALRYGEKISLGKRPYLAASCMTILNYLLDRQFKFCS